LSKQTKGKTAAEGPEPTISGRLEDVRKLEGFGETGQLRAFYDAVIEPFGKKDDKGKPIKPDGFPSYAAARTYHNGRTPPVEYLVAVARRFGYRLEWLATGKGEPHPALDELARDQVNAVIDQRIAAVFPEYVAVPRPVRLLQVYPLLEEWRRLRARRGAGVLTWEGAAAAPVDPEDAAFYQHLRRYIVGPVVGVSDPRWMRRDHTEEFAAFVGSVGPRSDGIRYLIAACAALQAAMEFVEFFAPHTWLRGEQNEERRDTPAKE
jgi:hypothetical protein